MFTNIANFSNTNDYLPLLNGILITDLFVIMCLNMKLIKSVVLKEWYGKYNLSAVIADKRAIYNYVFDTFSIIKFISLAVLVQVIHDVLFYLFFKNVPRGMNMMLDTFKDYANEMSYKAVLADSGMMILASLIASFLAGKTLNTNIIVLVVFVYLLPYFLYN